MKRLIVAILVMIFTATITYASNLSETQKENLALAYHYGQQIEFRGQNFGETVAAILFQESKAGSEIYQINGIIVGDRKSKYNYKSLGPMQVQIPAVRDVGRWYPHIFEKYFETNIPTNEELLVLLLTDSEFNIEVGAAYFQKMLELTGSWSRAILAYNRGANNNGNDPNDYVRKVKHWRLTVILPFIKNLK